MIPASPPPQDWQNAREIARRHHENGQVLTDLIVEGFAVVRADAAARIETARVAAYRAARVFEPSLEGYGAAMAVYIAAFGEPGGDGAVLIPDGPKNVETLHAEHALLTRIERLEQALRLMLADGGPLSDPVSRTRAHRAARVALGLGASHVP